MPKFKEEISNSVGAGGIAGIGQDAIDNGIPVKKKKKEEDMEQAGEGRKLGFKEFVEKIQEEASHSLKVGDILVNVWGWSMTIADFYIVQEVKDKSVKVQRLQKVSVGGDSFSPKVQPNGTQLDSREKPLVKKVLDRGYGPCLKMEDGYARPWDGKPVSENHLD